MSYKIAVLITCYNRCEKTLSCLTNLFAAELPRNFELHIFLVDDGSDGTAATIKKRFPQVNVIYGNGHLFWNGGMRLAWQKAIEKNSFDFFLWLNDDTLILQDAIIELYSIFNRVIKETQKSCIVVGACKSNERNNTFSYGGRDDKGPVLPISQLQKCKYINGNLVLVPSDIFIILGNLSREYTHAIGDNDYGLRAIENGFSCYTTTKYVAICPQNDIPGWCNPKIPLQKRFELLHSPKGLCLKEYIIFRKKFWGKKWIIFAIKAFVRMLIPSLYNKIR